MFFNYKYMDSERNLKLKGRVAKSIQTVDVFLMTEFLFSGIIKTLTNEELLAAFSLMLTHAKGRGEIPLAVISDNFLQAQVFL